MWFSEADSAALGRCLAQIADRDDDLVDLFLERRSLIELRPDEPGPGAVERRESGFSVRLVRAGTTYLAARDSFESGALESALREVSRAAPGAPYRIPELVPEADSGQDWEPLVEIPARLRSSLREHHAALDFRLRVARRRRIVRLVGPRLSAGEQSESFFSLDFATSWGRFGYLLADLDQQTLEWVVGAVLDRFRARRALSKSAKSPVVLGPAAAAVLLHEAVAHALEADTLVLSGRPEAALGVALGSELLDVVDDPAGMPATLDRQTDDEGMPVTRRWLLKGGRVRQPLADRFHADRSAELLPGAARRASRHLPPVPRSTHLSLAAGDLAPADLLDGEAGIFFAEISRGRLDALTGEVVVEFPYGRRFAAGELGDWVGPVTLRAGLAEILSAVEAVAAEAQFTGAGWCAKGGHRLPVWATSSALRLAGLKVDG